VSSGGTIALDDLRFGVLWPDPGCVPRAPPESGREINDRSIVLLGTIGGLRVLLTGDLEDDVDPVLIARGLPRIDLLKVAHHGSATASSEALLEAIRPRVAAISVGADNTYGHPATATLDRLRSVGARVFRTDIDGSIEISFAAGRMSVATSNAHSEAAPPEAIARAAAPAPPFNCAIPSPG